MEGFPAREKVEAMCKERTTSRREFLRNCVAGAVAINTAGQSTPSFPGRAVAPPARSRVSIARDPLLRGAPRRETGSSQGGNRVDPTRILVLLDQAVHGIINAGDPSGAWTKAVRPGQRVGLKVNTLGGRGLSTNVLLVEAICERLREAGIKASDIVIWDRDSEELERAGFRIRSGGNQVQCYGTDRVGYSDYLASFGSVGSRLSKILIERCDVLINVPVLKDHDGAGVTIALKNMYGVIHNPNKYHPDGCNPYIADVNALPELRCRLRLHICDATTACFEGGPGFKPQFAWRANTLIVSTDPVALDYSGWQMIERKRAAEGLKTLTAEGRAPNYIATAADARHRLGNNDPRRITVVETQVA